MPDQYKTLIEYLKQLHKEGAVISFWLPDYEMQDGKQTGKFWIEVEGHTPTYHKD